MSKFSGKCDLYDHIMMSKMYDKGSYRVSDEWECFQIFKERTNGTIYQHKHLKVTPYNAELVSEMNSNFKITHHQKEVDDKRTKTGKSIKKWDTYTYFGTEYETLKELNSHGGVYVTIPIHFDTLLDLVKYYPYIVSMCASDSEKETVYVSKESWVDSEYHNLLESGYNSKMKRWYDKALADHYQEVSLRYYNPAGHEKTEKVQFDSEGIGHTTADINPNFPIRWTNRDVSHWSSPELVEKNIVKISTNDLKDGATTIEISYVENFDYPLYLD